MFTEELKAVTKRRATNNLSPEAISYYLIGIS
jgi:hypothetical protein